MSNLPMYEMLAKAFASEGVDTVFNLMGDGNMHWATAMSKIDGVQMIHARHEHCACAMAMGYHSATGSTGVASVTCGPGVTQISTALATAVRAHVPLVNGTWSRHQDRRFWLSALLKTRSAQRSGSGIAEGLVLCF
jgi:acetolactate synthase-1/2/3 large subunit